jgi:hypothetical protein
MGVVRVEAVATSAPSHRPLPRLLAVAGDAFDIVTGRPQLWLLGSAAFMLRGGVLLLLLPLLIVPSPVEIRLLLGGNLGSTGFSPELVFGVLGFAVAATLVLMAMLYGVAWLEVWSFERVAAGSRAASVNERRTAARVFSIQAAALSALALAAMPLALGAINVAYGEIVRPTGSGPLYDRIVGGVQGPLIFLGIAVVVVEAVSAIASRRILARDFAVAPAPSGQRWRPLVAALGWLVTLAVLLPSLWALSLIWHSVEQGLAGFQAPVFGAVAPAIVGLAVVWAVTVVLTGFASALRGALWTVQELR